MKLTVNGFGEGVGSASKQTYSPSISEENVIKITKNFTLTGKSNERYLVSLNITLQRYQYAKKPGIDQ
jgi:hypothetical protein